MDSELLSKVRLVISEKEIIDLIKELVEIPSYPGIDKQETKVAKYIHQLFLKEGIKSEIVPVVDGRCNVVAKLKGTDKGKTLLLTGHIDTVPPYDMENPFTVKIKDGNMIGRGVVDMKGPLACMIAAIIGIKRSGIKLDGDIVFAGVIDEEYNSEGTIDLIEKGIKADAAIVGEPSNLDICLAHRGLEWFEFFFEGKTVHGGKQKEGINAILKASNFIQRVEEKLIPKLESKVHPIIGTGSMNYGTINGGTQPSTVAGGCSLTMDRRWLPGEKYQDVINEYTDVINELRSKDNQFKCKLKVMENSAMRDGYVHEAMEIDREHPIIDIITFATEQIFNKKPNRTYFPAWSDGGLLSSYANIPTVIFAPGDLQTAHSADECLEISQIYPATLIYVSIAVEFCK